MEHIRSFFPQSYTVSQIDEAVVKLCDGSNPSSPTKQEARSGRIVLLADFATNSKAALGTRPMDMRQKPPFSCDFLCLLGNIFQRIKTGVILSRLHVIEPGNVVI